MGLDQNPLHLIHRHSIKRAKGIWLIVAEEVHSQRGFIDPEHSDVKSVRIRPTGGVVLKQNRASTLSNIE